MVADSANSSIFGAILSRTALQGFAYGIHNSKEDQKMWIPQKIRFWPVVESAYNAQNAQFGLVMYK